MSNANQYEREMLALINADRTEIGLEPLRLNTALNASAEDHSTWMLNNNTFSHAGSGGSSAGDRMMAADYPFEGAYAWAENIGYQSERGAPGLSDDIVDVHESLMNSPGHRANLLDPNLQEIGIGVEQGAFSAGGGSFDAVMVTQNFATTGADTSTLRDPETTNEGETPVEPEVPVAPETPIEPDMPDSDGNPMPEPDASMPEQPAPMPPVSEDVPDDQEPEMPVPELDTPVAEVPFLAGWFVDFSDVFEFRQDGEDLIFETSIEQLWDGFINAFEIAFGVDIDETMDETEMVDVTPVEIAPMAETPDFMFECV